MLRPESKTDPLKFGNKVEDLQQEEPSAEPNSSGSVSARRTRRSWTTWLIDGVLLAIVITGAWYAWPIQREAGRLHAKRMELQRIVGEMPIKDPTKYHVMLLKSENPLEWRWRIFVPAGIDTLLATDCSPDGSSSRSGFTGGSQSAQEGLLTATISQTDAGNLVQIKIRARSRHSNGTITTHVRGDTMQQMVSDKDTSSWQIAGRDGVEIISSDQVVSLLAIELPEKDAPKRAGFLNIRVGTQEVIDKSRKQ